MWVTRGRAAMVTMTESNPLPETVQRANRADNQHTGSNDADPERPTLTAIQMDAPNANVLCIAEDGNDGDTWIEADANAVVNLDEEA